jgi:hypothetical protein
MDHSSEEQKGLPDPSALKDISLLILSGIFQKERMIEY